MKEAGWEPREGGREGVGEGWTVISRVDCFLSPWHLDIDRTVRLQALPS